MKFFSIRGTFAIVLVAVAALPARSAGRIALLPAVDARAASLHLADLLPADAPAAILRQAGAIALGSAPSPGSQRTLGRAVLLRALRGSPALLNSLEIPASITVTRWSRALRRGEVLAAIQKCLAASRIDPGEPLSIDDVDWVTPVAVTEDTPALDILRIEPGRGETNTQFALWITSEPLTPPFWVSLNRVIAAPPMPHASKVTAPAPAQALAQNSPPLVQAGKPLQLIIQGGGMRITATATALQPGRAGQQIRVQCLPAGKILVATVTALQTAVISY